MPSTPEDRRSSGTSTPPTALGLEAQQPLTTAQKIGVSIGSACVFVLAMGDFVYKHFIEKHTDAHTFMGSAIEYGPFIVLSGLAAALFIQPQGTVQFILRSADKGVGMIPGLRGGKERREDG